MKSNAMVKYRKIRFGLSRMDFLMMLKRKRQMESLLEARLRVKAVSDKMVYLIAVVVRKSER